MSVLSSSAGLPGDLRERSVQRLALLASLFIVVGAFEGISTHAIKALTLPGYPSRAEAMDALGVAFMVATSGCALWILRQTRFAVKSRAAWGVGYLLLLAQLLSLTDHADYFWKGQHALHGVPFVTVLMVTFPALVPMPPLQALALSTLMGLTGPAALWVYHLVLGYEAPSWEPLSSTFRPFVPFVSAAVAQVVHQLGLNLKTARQLGSYTLVEELGRGGMGIVYRAEHAMLRRPTAIKMLQLTRVSDAALVRFRHEVELTARLTHPNTVTVYDYGHASDGTFYYAMELLEGVTLQDVVEMDGAQSEGRVLHILRQILGALAEAHDAQLIHRDIKPKNIMLVSRGGLVDWVKVLDFGLVRDLSNPDGSVTASNIITGTPQFLSPEAIIAPERIGPPSDIYAVGAVVYFLLTGQNVFSANTVVELCAAHLRDEPVTPSVRLGEPIDSALEALILSCLRKDPALRPPHARALLRELDHLLPDSTWSERDALAWWHRYQGTIDQKRKAGARAIADRTMDVRAKIFGHELRRSF